MHCTFVVINPRFQSTLEEMTLEELLQNVKLNHPLDDEDKINEIQAEVSKLYSAYRAVRTGCPVKSTSRKFQINAGTVRRWKHERSIPEILEDYIFAPLSPEPETRSNLIYLMGVYAHHHGGLIHYDKSFDKIIPEQDSRDRVSVAIEHLIARKPNIKGERLSIYTPKLMQVLHYAMDHFTTLVDTDEKRRSFVQGFFDAYPINVLTEERSGLKKIRITIMDYTALDALAISLFELGIYPLVDYHLSQLTIHNSGDLKRLYDLELDRLGSFFQSLPFKKQEIQDYYLARKIVKVMAERKEKIVWGRIAVRFGVTYHSLQCWAADLVLPEEGQAQKEVSTYDQSVPTAVKRYETLLQHFNLPNIYTATEPTKRNEKWFIPAGEKVFWLSPAVQEQYAAILRKDKDELTSDDYVELQTRLIKQLQHPSPKKYGLICTFDEHDQITSINYTIRELRSTASILDKLDRDLPPLHDYGSVSSVVTIPGVRLIVDDAIYILTEFAKKKYFHIYQVEEEPFNPEHEDHLRQELQKFLKKRKPDILFKIEGNIIKNIYFSTRMEERSDEYVGIKEPSVEEDIGD